MATLLCSKRAVLIKNKYHNSWVEHKKCQVIKVCWEHYLGPIVAENKRVPNLSFLAK